jgi:hypothetical protein
MFMAAAEFLPARLLPDNATDHNREIALTTPAAPPKVIKDYRPALSRSQSRALRGFRQRDLHDRSGRAERPIFAIESMTQSRLRLRSDMRNRGM